MTRCTSAKDGKRSASPKATSRQNCSRRPPPCGEEEDCGGVDGGAGIDGRRIDDSASVMASKGLPPALRRVSGCSGAPPSRPLPEEEAVVVNGVLVLVVGFVGGGLRVEKEPAGCVVISSTRTPATAAEVLLLRFGFGDILLRGGIMIADGKGGGSLARTDGRTVAMTEDSIALSASKIQEPLIYFTGFI
jgi:hypothetical protein